MNTAEYSQMRQMAQRLNSLMVADHPCRRGEARCCVNNFPITFGDAVYILNGIGDGKISKETAQHAKRQGQDPNNIWCAFLGNKRSCTIYDYRPLVCVFTGAWAVPNNPEDAERVAVAMHRGEISLPLTQGLTTTMCPECKAELISRGSRISTEALRLSQQLFLYTHRNQYTTIDQFVLNLTVPRKRNKNH